jgi:hypothetical protein
MLCPCNRRFYTIIVDAADSPASFLDDGPTSKLIRQILGAVSEFDKAMIVAKLRGARERVRRTKGKCEGRKSYQEARPETVRSPGNYAGNCRGRRCAFSPLRSIPAVTSMARTPLPAMRASNAVKPGRASTGSPPLTAASLNSSTML